jgi:hypothetical protein
MKFYASLDEDNVVVATITLHEDFENDNERVKEVEESEFETVLGKVWKDGKFIDNPNPPIYVDFEELQMQDRIEKRKLMLEMVEEDEQQRQLDQLKKLEQFLKRKKIMEEANNTNQQD